MNDLIERLRDDQPSERQMHREARIVLHSLLIESANEIERLRDKCDKQAAMLRRLMPDRFSDTPFIHSLGGERDSNGMPQRVYVVPSYGCDFSYVYEWNGKTVGPEW